MKVINDHALMLLMTVMKMMKTPLVVNDGDENLYIYNDDPYHVCLYEGNENTSLLCPLFARASRNISTFCICLSGYQVLSLLSALSSR